MQQWSFDLVWVSLLVNTVVGLFGSCLVAVVVILSRLLILGFSSLCVKVYFCCIDVFSRIWLLQPLPTNYDFNVVTVSPCLCDYQAQQLKHLCLFTGDYTFLLTHSILDLRNNTGNSFSLTHCVAIAEQLSSCSC